MVSYPFLHASSLLASNHRISRYLSITVVIAFTSLATFHLLNFPFAVIIEPPAPHHLRPTTTPFAAARQRRSPTTTTTNYYRRHLNRHLSSDSERRHLLPSVHSRPTTCGIFSAQLLLQPSPTFFNELALFSAVPEIGLFAKGQSEEPANRPVGRSATHYHRHPSFNAPNCY